MTEKDVRGYVNPYVPGALTPDGQKVGMPAEIYFEDRKGCQIDALIRSVRKGTVVQVHELFYLAPGAWRPQKRRRILGERIEAIHANGGIIEELGTGYSSTSKLLPKMMLRAYERIASSGRARRHSRPGRPNKWVLTAAELEVIGGLWRSREHKNDADRTLAVQQRIGRPITRAWLRRAFGSPHGR